MTGLGTRGCQGVRLDLELDRVCQVVRSLKAKYWRLNSRRSEFECRRLDLVSIGSEFVSVVHKGVMGRNNEEDWEQRLEEAAAVCMTVTKVRFVKQRIFAFLP